jgi:hypothetical protein
LGNYLSTRNFDKNILGYVLGDFFNNSSSHPANNPFFKSAEAHFQVAILSSLVAIKYFKLILLTQSFCDAQQSKLNPLAANRRLHKLLIQLGPML